MAFKDTTRVGDTHHKKTRSLMTVNIGADELKEYQDASGNYLVGVLPADALISQAYVFTGVASDAGALTLGTTEGGTEILSAGDTATPGQSGTFTGRTQTGSGKPVYMGLAAPATTGAFVVFIEYSEYRLNTGELTKINPNV
jgi:hypothetical protein